MTYHPNSIDYLKGVHDRVSDSITSVALSAAIIEIIELRRLLCEAVDLKEGQMPRKAPDAAHAWLYDHRLRKEKKDEGKPSYKDRLLFANKPEEPDGGLIQSLFGFDV